MLASFVFKVDRVIYKAGFHAVSIITEALMLLQSQVLKLLITGSIHVYEGVYLAVMKGFAAWMIVG